MMTKKSHHWSPEISSPRKHKTLTKYWFNPYSAGIVFIRQNITSVDGQRTVRIKIFILAIDPSNWYSNEAVGASQVIYNGLKLKKTFGLHCLYKNISAL